MNSIPKSYKDIRENKDSVISTGNNMPYKNNNSNIIKQSHNNSTNDKSISINHKIKNVYEPATKQFGHTPHLSHSSLKKDKKRVTFKDVNNLVEVIDVVSYKQYNVINSFDDPDDQTTPYHCKCIIF
jgi:hypothetical protein